MASNTGAKGRLGKLAKFFGDVLHGNRKIQNTGDAKLFMEAIQSHDSSSACSEALVANSNGLEAVRTCVRVDVSSEFIQAHTLRFISVFLDSSVKALADGRLLRQLLLAIVVPSTFWDALSSVFFDRQLGEESLRPFAWFVHELLEFRADDGLDISAVAADGGLLRAKDHETRQLAYKIEKLLKLRITPSTDSSHSPGGRHNNDFADFRSITIYPTSDEFLATEHPFYRQAKEIFEAESTDRAAMHLDNQFRLMREDMLSELRDDLKIALGRQKGRRLARPLQGLHLVDVVLCDEHRGKKFSLAVECVTGLEELQKIKPESRTKYLNENWNYLKHQSFGALLQGAEICGFAFIERNVPLLSKDPPVICLQLSDVDRISAVLHALRSGPNVQFVLVDTPVFAYQPVLEGLKRMGNPPLLDALLDRTRSESENVDFEPSPSLESFISKLQSSSLQHGSSEFSVDLAGEKWRLDQTQLKSLISGFQNQICAIQGPPGEL
jgi:hypothetical protein